MDQNAMELEIVTPARSLLRAEVSEFVGPGWLGQFGVRPGHAAMIVALRGGVVTYTTVSGETGKIAVGGGFAVVNPERATILADVAEFANEIDVARARDAETKARASLEGVGLDDPSYAERRTALERAVARIEAAA
jgi:F-type H+-transporting ATPase subunit epsilon